MYLLDSDIVIWLSRKNKQIVKLVTSLIDTGITSISTITIAEVYAGILPKEVDEVEKLLGKQEIIPVTSEIARSSGDYLREFSKKFKNISLADCLIAATAKEEKLTLVTTNKRHFPMEDIKIRTVSAT